MSWNYGTNEDKRQENYIKQYINLWYLQARTPTRKNLISREPKWMNTTTNQPSITEPCAAQETSTVTSTSSKACGPISKPTSTHPTFNQPSSSFWVTTVIVVPTLPKSSIFSFLYPQLTLTKPMFFSAAIMTWHLQRFLGLLRRRVMVLSLVRRGVSMR